MRRKRAQSTLEYAIILAVVIGGLIFLSVYLRRGYQGKLRETADDMGNQFDPFATTTKEVSVSLSYQEEDTASGVTHQESMSISGATLDSEVTDSIDLSDHQDMGQVQIITSEEETEKYDVN